MLDFSKIYSVHEARTGAFHVRCIEEKGLVDDWKLANASWRPARPIRFKQYMGRGLEDYITGGCVGYRFLSERAIRAFEAEGITGLSTYPVEIFNQEGVPVLGYQGVSVIGRCGPILNERSQRIIVPPISGAREKGLGKAQPGWRGIYFDPDTWDGSDIFLAEGTIAFYATDRVREVVEKHGLTNISFDPLSEIERLML
jgi:hypothetical protein